MNKFDINVMNKIKNKALSAMAVFALVVSLLTASTATTLAQAGPSADLNLSTNLSAGLLADLEPLEITDFTGGSSASSAESGEVVTVSSGSSTTCSITADNTVITRGGSVNLDWSTTGFDDITINGEAVSGESGRQTIGSLLESTTFTLVAVNNEGSRCTARVSITCIPPEVAKECELEVIKTVDTHTAAPGEELTYTIKVKNTGEADCTGGGVRIEDKLDANIAYVDSTYTSNLSPGYGTKSVYENTTHTLYFNGNTLTPGESGTIVWTGSVKTPATCGDFKVTNQAKATAKELNNYQNWSQSDRVITDIHYDCVIVVCDKSKVTAELTAYEADIFSVTFTNPNDCPVHVGGTSYKVPVDDDGRLCSFANQNLDCQVRYDFQDIILLPNTVQEITVAKPSKCFQIDWYHGKSIETFSTIIGSEDAAYGSRLIGARFVASVEDCAKTLVEKTATVIAHKIVCEDESQLPNYGVGGPDITADTAADWVALNNSCSFKSGWDFEWTDDQSNDPTDNFIGSVGSPWKTFGSTGVNGETSTTITIDTLSNNRVWFREVLQSGYIPFTHGLNGGTNIDDVSAEFYCNTDVINYDNRDFINGMQDGETYYCVAWNVAETEVVVPPSCDLFAANPTIIMVGASTTLSWETTDAVQVFINNGIGAVAVDGSVSVSPLADIIYTLTAIGAEDKSVDCTVPVTVSADPVPVCQTFIATPGTLPVGGGSVVLDWEVLLATNVSIAPTIGVIGLVGSQSVNITESTTYTLTATDDNGDEVRCTAPITVADLEVPFTCADNVVFSTSDSSITRGQDTVLNWSTTDVDTVSISTINAITLSGTQSVTPANDITYILTATQGSKSIDCPVSVNVSTGGGGGGGGSSTPRCELDISDTKIKSGEEITLTWDTSRATDVSITDSFGKVIFNTDDFLSSEKDDYFDGSITLKPTRDTEYTLLAERGSRERECSAKVAVGDDVVVLQTRDQQPLVAGISLSQVPYTGFEAGPVLTIMFYMLLAAWALYIAYVMVIRKQTTVPAASATAYTSSNKSLENMRQSEELRPDAFVASVKAPAKKVSVIAPSNLPTGAPVIGYQNHAQMVDVNPHQVDDVLVTGLENRAHAQKALLSSDAVRHFVGTTSGSVERNESLDQVIAEAKKKYPVEDGWVIVNESRMRELCVTCQVNHIKKAEEVFTPATVPEGTGSLAEAVVTGNVVAAYALIGQRPMFALADASADLDALYRNRRGESTSVSEMLLSETKDLSDEQIANMIKALTGAIDGTYTDEASAVKMAIMKAIKSAS
jgi:uncharacterized repeat protein (TIGR01451 family)